MVKSVIIIVDLVFVCIINAAEGFFLLRCCLMTENMFQLLYMNINLYSCVS